MKTVIGVIGPVGSGKDTVAEYISGKLNAPHFQISNPLKEIAQKRGLELSRNNLVELGTQIAKEYGADYLAKVLVDKIENTGVISGMRQMMQIEYLQKHSLLFLISVDADPAIRFTRSKERGKLGEAATIEEFVKNELDENSGHHVQRLFECMQQANFHLKNDGDLNSLYRQLDTIVNPYVSF
jgi:dephospho-CoA kinase